MRVSLPLFYISLSFKAFGSRADAETFMNFERASDAVKFGLTYSQRQRDAAQRRGRPKPVPAQARPRASSFFNEQSNDSTGGGFSPPSTPESTDTQGLLQQESPPVPHVNRSDYSGSFAVDSLKRINKELTTVQGEILELRREADTPLRIGDVLVRKAKLLNEASQTRFLRLALGSADTNSLTKAHLSRLREQGDQVWPLVNGALTIYRREIAETKRSNTALRKEKAELQERIQREIATTRRARQDLAKDKADLLHAQKLYLLDQKKLARNWEDFNNQQERRNNNETTTTRLDIDTDTDSFCDSEGHYRPELEEAHDRKQRAKLRESENDLELASSNHSSSSNSPPTPRKGSGTLADRHQTLHCNDGTVLTRSPCALGEDWVRYRFVDGIIGERFDDDEDDGDKYERAEATKGKNKKAEATKGKYKKAEATSPYERAKKKFAKKTKELAAEEGTTTTHKTGTRIQCLGCGEVLTILPSRVFPEYCEPCTEWYYEVCDKFADLESSTGNKEDTESQLAELWERQGGDPFYLQETKEKWEEGALTQDTSAPCSSSSSASSVISSSSASSTNKKAKKAKKKRKKQREVEVATVNEESGDDDDDNKDGDIDPRQLGWEEYARRGRIEGNSSLYTRGRPRARSKK